MTATQPVRRSIDLRKVAAPVIEHVAQEAARKAAARLLPKALGFLIQLIKR